MALFDAESLQQVGTAQVSGIGFDNTFLGVSGFEAPGKTSLGKLSYKEAVDKLLDWFANNVPTDSVAGVGHRLVHGGPQYQESVRLTPKVLTDIQKLEAFDPEHLPGALELVKQLSKLFPDAVQVACFDTSFHKDLPAAARRLPLPSAYDKQGIRRYGFHGLSCAYIMQRLDAATADSRVIIAHLGNGSSLTAVNNRVSVDTTMSFTPNSGIPMSTRSGDLDPGLIAYIMQTESLSPQKLSYITGFQSGLLGISETTADMERLLQTEDDDKRAAEAVSVYCHAVKKAIGALTAVMGGLDCLVFTGGIGEKAPKIRRRVCQDLGFLGISLDEQLNHDQQTVISASGSSVSVRVIPANEAQIITQEVHRLSV